MQRVHVAVLLINHATVSKFFVMLLLVFWTFIAVGSSPNPDFRIVPSVNFRLRDHVVPYETTAKVFFRMKLPSINSSVAENCTTNNVLCRAKMALFDTYNSNVQTIQTLAANNTRESRQLGIVAAAAGGYFLSSMVSKFSRRIFGTENDVSTDIAQMRRILQQNNKEFLLFEASVHKYAIEMTSTVTSITSKQNDILVALTVLSAINQIESRFRNIQVGLTYCINGRLPFTLIDADELRKSLHQISDKVRHYGLKLSVSTRSIGDYYKLEIADCVVTKTSITVLANIPLATQNWKIVDVLPVPFAFGHHTCELSLLQPITAAAGKEFVLMDDYAMEFCGTRHGQLCFVPSLTRSKPGLNDCIRNMYSGVRSDTNLERCPMDCTKTSTATITEISPAIIVATNVQSIHVECPYHVQDYSVDQLGAVEVKIHCNCSYLIGNYSISSSSACAEGEHYFTDVISIVPDAWTLLEYSPDFILKSALKQSVLKQELELNLPIERSDLASPYLSYSFDLNGILLVAVLVLVGILFSILGILIRSHCRLMMV